MSQVCCPLGVSGAGTISPDELGLGLEIGRGVPFRAPKTGSIVVLAD